MSCNYVAECYIGHVIFYSNLPTVLMSNLMFAFSLSLAQEDQEDEGFPLNTLPASSVEESSGRRSRDQHSTPQQE